MIVVVYFDVFYKALVDKLPKHKLVHYTQIPATLIPSTLIITGSQKRILREPMYPELNDIINRTTGIVIGICYGFQYLARLSRGILVDGTYAFRGVKNGHYYNHYDKVVELSKSWIKLEYQDDFISIAREPRKHWIGYQFHPEKKQTDYEKYIASLL